MSDWGRKKKVQTEKGARSAKSRSAGPIVPSRQRPKEKTPILILIYLVRVFSGCTSSEGGRRYDEGEGGRVGQEEKKLSAR